MTPQPCRPCGLARYRGPSGARNPPPRSHSSALWRSPSHQGQHPRGWKRWVGLRLHNAHHRGAAEGDSMLGCGGGHFFGTRGLDPVGNPLRPTRRPPAQGRHPGRQPHIENALRTVGIVTPPFRHDQFHRDRLITPGQILHLLRIRAVNTARDLATVRARSIGRRDPERQKKLVPIIRDREVLGRHGGQHGERHVIPLLGLVGENCPDYTAAL